MLNRLEAKWSDIAAKLYPHAILWNALDGSSIPPESLTRLVYSSCFRYSIHFAAHGVFERRLCNIKCKLNIAPPLATWPEHFLQVSSVNSSTTRSLFGNYHLLLSFPLDDAGEMPSPAAKLDLDGTSVLLTNDNSLKRRRNNGY
jgi:hypothetical protein